MGRIKRRLRKQISFAPNVGSPSKLFRLASLRSYGGGGGGGHTGGFGGARIGDFGGGHSPRLLWLWNGHSPRSLCSFSSASVWANCDTQRLHRCLCARASTWRSPNSAVGGPLPEAVTGPGLKHSWSRWRLYKNSKSRSLQHGCPRD
jgi:hypothetical protein